MDKMPKRFDTSEEVERAIQEEYHDSGIFKYFQRNSPELFIILVRQVIPKRREQLLCMGELMEKKEQLMALDEKLTTAEIIFNKCRANLRFWEKDDKYWGWLNNAFDWLLKMGLSVVPILSLFSILGISFSNMFEKGELVSFVIFSSLALVWLTSATICNWIISRQNSSSGYYDFVFRVKDFKIIDLGVNPTLMNGFLFFLIWFSEALIGFAAIPTIIELQRDNRNLPPLGGFEKFEILIGVSIFAFINILFAIAKGRIYKFNTPKKIELGAALAERDRLQFIVQTNLEEIQKLEAKIASLEDEVRNPKHYLGDDYFNKMMNELSISVMEGKENRPIEPSDIYHDYEEKITNNSQKVS